MPTTLERHTARWLELPWVETIWNDIVGRPLLPAIQARIIRPMLQRGIDPGRHRMQLSLDRDSASVFLNVRSSYPDASVVAGMTHGSWLLRPCHERVDDDPQMENLEDFISFVAAHYVRRDRILSHMGETGRFRVRDPAWSYDVHPVLAAHLRGHSVTPDQFLSDIVHSGAFRSTETCVSRCQDQSALLCSLPERLGYVEGEVVHGDIALRKLDLSREVTFDGTRNAIVLRRCDLPQTLISGMIGQHATRVVGHHALDVPGLDVVGSRRRGGNVEFLVRAGSVPLAEGRPEGFDAPAAPIPYAIE